jgi:arsenate reductase (glutaredoxin)
MLVEQGPDGLPAGVIAERLGVPASSLSFHLQQLLHAGLVTQRRVSRQLFYAADFAAMNRLVAYLNVLGLIRNAGIEPIIIEYLKTPPSRAELTDLIARAGLSVRDALRQKGMPYAELGLDDPALSDDALLDAMMAHPILINRPFVVTPSGVKGPWVAPLPKL